MKTIAYIIAFILLGQISASAQRKENIYAEYISIERALQKSKESGKLIFLQCSTNKRKTITWFYDKPFSDFYKANFICLNINVEKNENRYLMTKYNLKSLPALLFINSKDEVVHRDAIAKHTNWMIGFGETAMDTSRNYQSILKRLSAGDNSYKTINDALKSEFSDTVITEMLLDQYFKDKRPDQWFEFESWKLISKSPINSKYFKFLLANEAQFKKLHGIEAVDNYLQKIFRSFSWNYQYSNFDWKGCLNYLHSLNNINTKKVIVNREKSMLCEGLYAYPDSTAKWIKMFSLLDSLAALGFNEECNSSYIYAGIDLFHKQKSTYRTLKKINNKWVSVMMNNFKFQEYALHLKADSTITNKDIKILISEWKDVLDTSVEKGEINALAMAMVKHPRRNQFLQTAKQLSAFTLVNHRYYYFDTYAAICAQLGEFEEAIKNQEIAIAIVKEQYTEKTTSYKDKLEKYKRHEAVY